MNIFEQLKEKGFDVVLPETKEEKETKATKDEKETKEEKEVKATKKKEVKEELMTKETDVTDEELMTVKRYDLSLSSGRVTLPSPKDIIGSGKALVIGKESVINKTMIGFLPITWLKIAQAIKNPNELGKIIYGKDDSIKIFDKAFLPLIFHAWERQTTWEGEVREKPQPTITLYMFSPEDNELYALSAKNYELEPVKKLAQRELGFWYVEAEKRNITFKDKLQKEQKSWVMIPKFIRCDKKFNIDSAILQEKIEVIEEHLTKFFNNFPDQNPANDDMPF